MSLCRYEGHLFDRAVFFSEDKMAFDGICLKFFSVLLPVFMREAPRWQPSR